MIHAILSGISFRFQQRDPYNIEDCHELIRNLGGDDFYKNVFLKSSYYMGWDAFSAEIDYNVFSLDTNYAVMKENTNKIQNKELRDLINTELDKHKKTLDYKHKRGLETYAKYKSYR